MKMNEELQITFKDLQIIFESLYTNRLFLPTLSIEKGTLCSIDSVGRNVMVDKATRIFVWGDFAPSNVSLKPVEILDMKLDTVRIWKKLLKRHGGDVDELPVIMTIAEHFIFFSVYSSKGHGRIGLKYRYCNKGTLLVDIPYAVNCDIPMLNGETLLDTSFNLSVEAVKRFSRGKEKYTPRTLGFKTFEDSIITLVGDTFITDFIPYTGWSHIHTILNCNILSFLKTCENPVQVYFGFRTPVLFVEQNDEFTFSFLVGDVNGLSNREYKNQ